jgi:hypothetical protein
MDTNAGSVNRGSSSEAKIARSTPTLFDDRGAINRETAIASVK